MIQTLIPQDCMSVGALRHFSSSLPASLGKAYTEVVDTSKLPEAVDRVPRPTLSSDSDTTIALRTIAAPSQRGHGGQRVAERTQVAAGDQDDRIPQPADQIESSVLLVQSVTLPPLPPR